MVSERHELVYYAAKGPDISFLGVRLRLHDLRAGVKDGADEGLHHAG